MKKKATNNSGGEPIDFDKMSEFDRLPGPIRQFLSDAPYSYNPRMVRAAWLKSGMSAEDYAGKRMPQTVARDMAKRGATA